eukprot:526348-Pelagomonas_calceolata.AAC.1
MALATGLSRSWAPSVPRVRAIALLALHFVQPMSNRVFCCFLAWGSTLGPDGGRVVNVGLCEALKK